MPANETGPGKKGSSYTVRAAERVCGILDLLQASQDGVPLAAIANAMGLPKSSVFRYMVTLEAHRYVERNPETGTYQLGLAFLPFRARQFEILARRARPRLESLRDSFKETINLGMLDGRRVAYVDIVESPQPVRLAARRGDSDWIHSTALGKAIAADLPVERIRAMLTEEGMPKCTEYTITNIPDYFVELERVRELGYALDDRENVADGRCVAVPIRVPQLNLALSVSAPASRLTLEKAHEIAGVLSSVAVELADDLTGRSGNEDAGGVHAS